LHYCNYLEMKNTFEREREREREKKVKLNSESKSSDFNHLYISPVILEEIEDRKMEEG